jgi:hypothetical protein
MWYIPASFYFPSYIWCGCVTLFFFFFFGGSGVWTQGLTLAKQMLLTLEPLVCVCVCVCVCVLDIFEVKGLVNYLPGAWPLILLISASQVARITGMSHWCPKLVLLLKSWKVLREEGTQLPKGAVHEEGWWTLIIEWRVQ